MNNYLKRKNDQSLFEESSSFKDFFQMPFFKQDTILKTDIIENKNNYTLIIDIPGCNKNDVTIYNEDGYLTVEVSHNSNNDTSNLHYLKKERLSGVSSRSYYLGNNVDVSKISATFTNGTLEVTIPSNKQDSQPTYIPIK